MKKEQKKEKQETDKRFLPQEDLNARIPANSSHSKTKGSLCSIIGGLRNSLCLQEFSSLFYKGIYSLRTKGLRVTLQEVKYKS